MSFNSNEIMILDDDDDDDSDASVNFVAEIEKSEILDVESVSQNCKNNNENNTNLNIKSKKLNSNLDDEIIEIKDISNSSIYKTICEKDKLLAEFIDKCLELEYEGMAKVVHTILLPYYNKADEAYKKSFSFKRVLNKAINRIETDPDHKFSHIKDLCETLDLHKGKKRVNLITLTDDINKNTRFNDRGTKRNKTQRANSKIKNKKVNVIEIDDEEQHSDTLSPLPVINLDECDNDVEIITKSTMQIVEDKENKSRKNENIAQPPDNLLVLKKVKNCNESIVIDDTEKIKKLEAQIAAYKDQIAKLDEQEVCDDSVRSPYIISEKLKAKVVGLYKEICAIKGAELIKRREIRLQVLHGHPPGPVKNLEKFLNDHIGSNGDPPFPDFIDVVNCVQKANITDSLNWNKSQIMNEAYALFTQCGQALQARRQQREWRDLLDCVKIERCDYDPADENPQLLERLNQNKQLAMKKESNILERYTRLQYSDTEIFSELSSKTNSAQASVQTKSFIVDNRNDESDSSELNEDSDVEELTNCENKVMSEREPIEHGNKILDVQISNYNGIEVSKTEKCSDKVICNSEKVNEIIKSSSTIIGIKQELADSIDVVHKGFNSSIPEASINEKCDNISQVNIKPDPDATLLKIMESFGNDYTTTIVEILDPFLIVEISSDSDTNDGTED